VQERRRSPRVTVMQRAHLVLPAIRRPMPCTIRNISLHGVLIHLDEPRQLEGRVSLLMNGTELRACHVVRRAGRDIGLSFMPS